MATNNTPKLARSEQSRINGAKSKGPTSAEGKTRSSANSMKHGFAAAINNVIVSEDKEAFDRHIAGYRAALMAQNYLEETLVDQLASVNWRQTRLVGLEAALLDAQLSFQKDVFLEIQPKAPTIPTSVWFSPGKPSHASLEIQKTTPLFPKPSMSTASNSFAATSPLWIVNIATPS